MLINVQLRNHLVVGNDHHITDWGVAVVGDAVQFLRVDDHCLVGTQDEGVVFDLNGSFDFDNVERFITVMTVRGMRTLPCCDLAYMHADRCVAQVAVEQ
jgi:hypothetical protein